MRDEKKEFGVLLREERVGKGYSLRKFAQLLGVSPTYLSQVEQGLVKTPPTAERVEKMAGLLGVDKDEWITYAGRVTKESEAILNSNPEMPALLRAVKGLTPEQIRKLAAQAERQKQAGSNEENL